MNVERRFDAWKHCSWFYWYCHLLLPASAGRAKVNWTPKCGGSAPLMEVKLPAERFDQHGQIRIPYKENLKPKDKYYKVWHVSYIKNGNPSLSRDHFQIVRQSDSKVLGESISYVRIGGDIPGPWHGSSFRCPENAGSPFLTRQIFIRSNGE